jgi:hypothetical protein
VTTSNPHRNPSGCDETYPGSDYSAEEREFLLAIDRYKRARRRPHPTWREVLDLLRQLGWRKAPPPDQPAA